MNHLSLSYPARCGSQEAVLSPEECVRRGGCDRGSGFRGRVLRRHAERGTRGRIRRQGERSASVTSGLIYSFLDRVLHGPYIVVWLAWTLINSLINVR